MPRERQKEIKRRRHRRLKAIKQKEKEARFGAPQKEEKKNQQLGGAT